MASIDQSTMASIDLPLDIIHTILLNLPIKSLLRFKIVCKSWNAIISDRQFAKTHRQKSNNSPKNLFLCRHTKLQKLHVCKFENRCFQIEAIRQQPLGNILCFGDGLVLLGNSTSTRMKVYILWNPSTRKQKKFYCPYVCYNDMTSFGLCHDPHLDDYKVVVRFARDYFVYSCQNKSWTNKQESQYELLYPNAGLFVDGFSFWTLKDKDNIVKDIVYFDPRDDKFKKLQKPEFLEGARTFYLTSLRGCLCSYDNTRRENFTRLRIWIMKGHVDLCSWSSLLSMEIVTAVDPLHTVWPVLFTENNEIVISVDRSSYRIRRSRVGVDAFKILAIDGHQIGDDFLMVQYQDSLLFPIQDSDRPKRKRSSSRRMNVPDII